MEVILDKFVLPTSRYIIADNNPPLTLPPVSPSTCLQSTVMNAASEDELPPTVPAAAQGSLVPLPGTSNVYIKYAEDGHLEANYLLINHKTSTTTSTSNKWSSYTIYDPTSYSNSKYTQPALLGESTRHMPLLS